MFSLFRDIYDPLDYNRFDTSMSLGSLMADYIPRHHVNMSLSCPRHQQSVGCPSNRQQLPKPDRSKYQIMLNVNHFRPDEVDVKTVDDFVVIHAKHEEQLDEHGFVSREFTRRYQLPDDVDPSTVTSSLSRDGILTIQAPRKVLEPPPNERIVPIVLQQPNAVEESQQPPRQPPVEKVPQETTPRSDESSGDQK